MSTLFVNNLNTASGTSIALASGKTLDASGGTLVPSTNQIIQVFEKEWTTATATTSASFVDVNSGSFSFTPKYSNSKLLFQGHFAARYDHNTSAGGAYMFVWNGNNVIATNNYQNYDDGAGNRYRMMGLHGAITAGTTSTATAKLQQAAYNGATLWTNWNGGFTSGFMVMEIAQ